MKLYITYINWILIYVVLWLTSNVQQRKETEAAKCFLKSDQKETKKERQNWFDSSVLLTLTGGFVVDRLIALFRTTTKK